MNTPHPSFESTQAASEGGKRAFLNMLRSLFNIDGYLLPELTAEQQLAFLRDPVRYLIGTDNAQSDAIFREVRKRQDTPVEVAK